MRKLEIVTTETLLHDPRAKALIADPELTTAAEIVNSMQGQHVPIVILPEVVSIFGAGLSYLKYRTTWNFESIYNAEKSIEERESAMNIPPMLLVDSSMDEDETRALATLLEIPNHLILDESDFLDEFKEDSVWRIQVVGDIILIQAEHAWQKIKTYAAEKLGDDFS